MSFSSGSSEALPEGLTKELVLGEVKQLWWWSGKEKELQLVTDKVLEKERSWCS